MRLAPALVGLALGLAAGVDARAETEAPPPPKPWLGIGFDPQSDAIAVNDVYPGTGAAAAGLQPDDIIVEIDGVPLYSDQLPSVIGERKVGQRVTLTVARPHPVTWGRLRLHARLTAMPTVDELVHRRLFDRSLPALTIFDRHDAMVPVGEWTRRPQVWMVFDAGCEACPAAATALRARLAASVDGASDTPFRTVVLGANAELAAFMARVPILGTVWRIERGERDRRSVARFFLSGMNDTRLDGVVLVIDHRGIVRFATAISAGESAHDGACAAAARAARAWRP